jgi:hypothetical protein
VDREDRLPRDDEDDDDDVDDDDGRLRNFIPTKKEPKQMHAHKIAEVTAVERISDGCTEEKAWLMLRCCKKKRAERCWRQNWSADILLQPGEWTEGRVLLDLGRPRAQKTQK